MLLMQKEWIVVMIRAATSRFSCGRDNNSFPIYIAI